MHPTVKTARIAGALYVSTLPIALYFWSYKGVNVPALASETS